MDWVGVNGYADYYFLGDPQYDDKPWVWTKFYQGHRANPLAKYRKIYSMFADRKPIMISEVGVAWYNRPNGQLVEDWGAYTLKRLYCYLPLVYPRIKAIYYFNSGVPKDFSRYAVCDNDKMLEAYREAIASPYYLDSCYGQSPFYYTLLGNSAPAELCDLAAYIDTGEARVGSVEYYLDGRLVGRSYKAPWEVSCRFPAKGGNAVLEVRTIGAGGGVIYKKAFKIYIPAWQPIRVDVNGKPLNFDVPPVIYNSRTMVPVRAIAESLGLTVQWNAAENSVVLKGQGREIVLRVDQQTALNNGREVFLPDAPPKLADGRVLLPLRWLAEALDFRVDWDGGQRLIRISK
ncbi:MAG: copper amine oxidase N-terminal domain-containing protein [Thermacetogeniaceae bacterium]